MINNARPTINKLHSRLPPACRFTCRRHAGMDGQENDRLLNSLVAIKQNIETDL
jgi:hypothetical protein